MSSDPRFPVGAFVAPKGALTPEERSRLIDAIEETPARMRDAVRGLSAEQLATPYRDGGWTVRQVAHHVPDSHMNAYIRFKLALTEDAPMVKPYDEARWAEFDDAKNEDVEVSLSLLEQLHRRWVRVLRAMSDSDFRRQLTHPEHGLIDLDRMLALYGWHGRHHVAHVTELRKRMGW